MGEQTCKKVGVHRGRQVDAQVVKWVSGFSNVGRLRGQNLIDWFV